MGSEDEKFRQFAKFLTALLDIQLIKAKSEESQSFNIDDANPENVYFYHLNGR